MEKNRPHDIFIIIAICFFALSHILNDNNQLKKTEGRLEALRTEIRKLQEQSATVSDTVVDLNRSITQLQREVSKFTEYEQLTKPPSPTPSATPRLYYNATVPDYPRTINENGFEPLFTSYSKQHDEGWIIQGLEEAGPDVLDDGTLKVGGWDYWAIISKKEFSDFILRFEVKFDSRGNSGILLHTPQKDIYKAVSRIEIQLESGDDPRLQGKPKSMFGAIERIRAPHVFPVKPIGKWNDVEIVYLKDNIWVRINGVIAHEAVNIRQYEELRDHQNRGSIAIQRNDFKKAVYFRNIRIKNLQSN